MPLVNRGSPDFSNQSLEEIKKRLNELEDLITQGNIRLESLVSIAIEREMITQDQYDKILNLLKELYREDVKKLQDLLGIRLPWKITDNSR